MLDPDAPLNVLSNRVIGRALRVHAALGHGFLEKIYENALALELRNNGLRVAQQYGITVRYEGVAIGEYAVDLLVEDEILLELKAVRALDDIHRAQCMNYLRATGKSLCLLMNFAKPRLEIKRIVQDL